MSGNIVINIKNKTNIGVHRLSINLNKYEIQDGHTTKTVILLRQTETRLNHYNAEDKVRLEVFDIECQQAVETTLVLPKNHFHKLSIE